ncbi:uncharacterized protein LAJ45_00128 [Morchella importuna]|uniref:uncharacterized protein n=1 Tax=Morchella importuna TaxID=1174673 RepID=UPI001E8D9438|nr:uncharacterized protein LAJ45_00128 [Morchella importuna]KAH8155119.1 hypothetical protein LAJ45_00128 [Morchella importuna]
MQSGNPNFSTGSSHFTTASCIVFVGNIPYEGLAETQLTEIFKSVGRVVCFRMVYDRETGRSKGYGFAEYIDAETAASAVRNLDGYDVMGRKLRVDYSSQGYVGKEGYPGRSDNASKDTAAAAAAAIAVAAANKDGGSTGNNMYPMGDYADIRTSYNPDTGYAAHSSSHNGSDNGRFTHDPNTNPTHTEHAHRFGPNLTHITLTSPTSESAPSPSAALAAFIGSLPQGVDNHPNLSTTDSISKTLSQIPAPQLLLALGQMKDLIATDPVKAAETLRYCPQLAHALFQAMVLMNLVKPEVVSQVLEASTPAYTTAASAAAAAAANNQLQIPQQQQQQQFQQNLIQQQYLLQQQQQQQQHMRQTTPQQQQAFYNAHAHAHSYPSPLPMNMNLSEFPEFLAAQQHHQQQQQMLHMQAAAAGQQQQQMHVVQQIQAAAQAAQAAQAQAQGQDTAAEEKAALLQRVKMLTQEEIARLPAEQAKQVVMLRQRLLAEAPAAAGAAGGSSSSGGGVWVWVWVWV